MADFYIRAAASLDRVLRDECSVKAAAAPHPDAGRVLAILINSLAYRSALTIALEDSKVFKLEEKVFTLTPTPPSAKSKSKAPFKEDAKNPNKTSKPAAGKGDKTYPSKEAFLLVLCHDLLFQSRGIQAAKTWPPKVTLERYKPSLHSALVKLQIRQGKSRIQDLRSGALYQEMTARIPRWIRINPLRATRQEVFRWLEENRFTAVEDGKEELGGVKEYVESKHVPGLLAFHPKATSGLLSGEVYRGNWVVMQDLASCFPAYILDPPRGGTVVDATSAPGNKTSHLSAIMYSKRLSNNAEDGEEDDGARGKIFAFERDAVRYKTLVKRLGAVGALQANATGITKFSTGNVVAERKDFLTTNPTDFSKVTHMLLDPSCSGSGIVNRLDFLKEDDDVEDTSPSSSSSSSESSPCLDSGNEGMTKLERRLKQLSEFQLLMIRHAFKFPSLRKVVYSTCSIHPQENEEVVIRALDTEEAKQYGWTLAPRKMVIPSWPVRGDKETCIKLAGKQTGEKVADSVIRCKPGGMGEGDKPHVESCNGFFVACFIKGHPSQTTAVDDENVIGNRKRPNPESNTDEDDVEEQQEAETKDAEAKQLKNGTGNSAANRKKKLQKRRKKQRLHHQQP
ncbi:uncharacterized protein UTRI_06401 [Ustilago trichophora]|uniref:SAM-dependent MTase RsmB/NOP-type domain-containing protein n=1 Tax=Ustilago trichophora TaxID=86804 RepID=A0A5C3ELR5_9BASI|nr:uncharacterized protein UTRI_06401 [Ustilago trichophora]